jgi:hypothetical protein
MHNGGEWLRVRGVGRERFAGYVADYLASLGFRVDRAEEGEPVATQLSAHLERMNPAIPDCAKEVRLRVDPTSGGGALIWQAPSEVPVQQRTAMDRFVRELALHVERMVLTESHGTAKVSRAPNGGLPWQPPNGGKAQAL